TNILSHAFLLTILESSYFLCFTFQLHRVPLDLHSFPTRRSSDLLLFLCLCLRCRTECLLEFLGDLAQCLGGKLQGVNIGRLVLRSEEHTSELQSRFDLVCRLLLEKKKT